MIARGTHSGFIERDADALRGLGAEVVCVGPSPFEIVRAVRRGATHVISWFAAEHAFYATWAARRRRLPRLTILGGFEGAKDDEIGYGLWTRPWHVRARAKYAIANASLIWTVEPSLAWRAFAYAGLSPRFRDVRVVPTIFDQERFRMPAKKDIDAAFVCMFADPTYRRLKGVDTVLAAFRQLRLEGLSVVALGDGAVEPGVPSERTLPLTYDDTLAGAKVIVNASRSEGLNNTICEAMLAGALPVVSAVPGNEYAIEGFPHGRTFRPGDAAALAARVREAAKDWTPRRGEAARRHVIDRFPARERIEAFRAFLDLRGNRP